jgi:hypothetical protein
VGRENRGDSADGETEGKPPDKGGAGVGPGLNLVWHIGYQKAFTAAGLYVTRGMACTLD